MDEEFHEYKPQAWLREREPTPTGISDEAAIRFCEMARQSPAPCYVDYLRQYSGLSLFIHRNAEDLARLHLLKPTDGLGFWSDTEGSSYLVFGRYSDSGIGLCMDSAGEIFHIDLKRRSLAIAQTLETFLRSLAARENAYTTRYVVCELSLSGTSGLSDVMNNLGLVLTPELSDKYIAWYGGPNGMICVWRVGAVVCPRKYRILLTTCLPRTDYGFQDRFRSVIAPLLEPHILDNWVRTSTRAGPTTATKVTPADSFRRFSHFWLERISALGVVSTPPLCDDVSAYRDYLHKVDGAENATISDLLHYVSVGKASLGEETALIDMLRTVPGQRECAWLEPRWAIQNIGYLVAPLHYCCNEDLNLPLEWLRVNCARLHWNRETGTYSL